MTWIAVAVTGGVAAGSLMSGRGGGVNYESPEPRNLYREAMDTMDAQEEIVPRMIDLRRQYGPEQIALNTGDLTKSLFGSEGGTITTETQPTRRIKRGVEFETAVQEQYPSLYAGYESSPHKRRGIPFQEWLKEHSENPKASLEGRQLASQLLSEGVTEYAEGEGAGQTVTRTIEAQDGLLGGPDAYRYDEQGNERGMAQRVDAYSREKTRQDIRAQRRGDIEDLRELAPQARESYMAANPEVADRLAQINQMADGISNRQPSALSSYATGAAPQAAPSSAIGGQALRGTANMMPTETGTGIAKRVSEPVPMGDYGKGTMGPREVGTAQMMPVDSGEPKPIGSSQEFVRKRIPQQAGELPSRTPLQRESVTLSPTSPSATAQGTAYAQGRLSNDVSGLQRELESQAQQELAAGSTLTAREQRDLTEASRSAFAGRGLERSNRALLGEMQNRIEGNRQRLAERRAFAAGVSGQGELMRRGRLQDTMNAGAQQFGQMATAEQLEMARENSDRAFALNAMNASRLVDPSQAILGRGLTSSNAGAFQQTMGSGMANSQMDMNPFNNSYASNLNSQNYQGALAGAQGNMMADYYNTQNTMDMVGTGLGFVAGTYDPNTGKSIFGG